MLCPRCGTPAAAGSPCPRCGLWSAAPPPNGQMPPGPPPPGFGPPRPPRVDHRRPATPPVLVGVTFWRGTIIAFALIGLTQAFARTDDNAGALDALSQSASLLTAIVYGLLLLFPLATGLRWHEPKSSWLRVATCMTLLIVCVVYMTMLDGDLSETWSLFEHMLTPIVVLADVLFVGRNQANTRGWTPLTWIAFPLAYVVFYNARELTLYDEMLSVDNPDFGPYILGFTAAMWVTGYVLLAVAKVKANVSAPGMAPPAQPGPGPQPPPYGMPPVPALPAAPPGPYPPQGQPMPGQYYPR